MQTIYHYRCDGCQEVHENSSDIFNCEICGAEICEDCCIIENGKRTCFDYCGEEKLSPREIIERFIKINRYTYKVEDILEEYKNKWGKSYVSCTMEICCKSLKNEIEALINDN